MNKDSTITWIISPSCLHYESFFSTRSETKLDNSNEVGILKISV